MEPEGWFSYSQDPPVNPILSHMDAVYMLMYCFCLFKYYLPTYSNVILLSLPTGLLTTIQHVSFISPTSATSPGHRILFDLIIIA
jgi:hypothetical protein